MENKGDWIKLNRNILNWEWYDDINACRLFIHCLLRANYDEQKWHGKIIKAGQFVTSYENLSNETGLTYRQVRYNLDKLKMTGEVAHKGTSQYSIITILNWDKWQANCQSECQEIGSKLATIKEIKKERIINKNIPTKKEILDYLNLLGKTIDVDEFMQFWGASDWLDKSGLPINWKQKVVSWKSNVRRINNNATTPAQEKASKIWEEIKMKEMQELAEGKRI